MNIYQPIKLVDYNSKNQKGGESALIREWWGHAPGESPGACGRNDRMDRPLPQPFQIDPVVTVIQELGNTVGPSDSL